MGIARVVCWTAATILAHGIAWGAQDVAERPQKNAEEKAVIVDRRMIWDQGKHNAFTDLVRFNDRWSCAFREGTGHGSNDGEIRVITSTDGDRWESAALLKTPDPARPDLRDAKLAVTPDGKLMLVAAGRDVKLYNYLTYTWFSDDGAYPPAGDGP
jgi:hypothetical protein